MSKLITAFSYSKLNSLFKTRGYSTIWRPLSPRPLMMADDSSRQPTAFSGEARCPRFLAHFISPPLDQAFENQSNVFYLRFCDDIVILAQTKSQFLTARKKLFRILRQLKLKLSDPKTRMGKLHDGFHFLGIQFQVQPAASQNLPAKIPVMSAAIHSRSCRRALERVRAMNSAVIYHHPADIQHYLHRWANWWANTMVPITVNSLFQAWRDYTRVFEPTLIWVAPMGYHDPNPWL